VQYIDVTLSNRVSLSFLETVVAGNVIFCRPLEESLNNISLITTKDGEFIHNYIEESSGNYLVTSVALDDGTVFKDVRFQLITIEEGKELPPSTINLTSLGTPSANDVLTPTQLIEEEYILPSIDEENDDFSDLHNISCSVDSSEVIQKVKILESKLIAEQQKIEQEKKAFEKERKTLEADRKLQKTLEDYKAELLDESFHIGEHQKNILEKAVNDLSISFQEQFDSQQINVNKYLDTLSQANLTEVKEYQDKQIEYIKGEINVLLTERLEENATATDKLLLERASTLEALFTEKIITELESHRRDVESELSNITTTIDGLVEKKLTLNNEAVDQLLVNRSGILQDQFNVTVTEQLDKHKAELFEEFKNTSTKTATVLFDEKTKELNTALKLVINEHRDNLNTTIDQKINEVSTSVSKFTADIEGKLPKLDETIKDINKRIQTLVVEKRNVQLLVDDAKKYTDTKVAQVSEEVMNYARRILDLGSGGGSNAVQYANGGTMNGSLNVTGQYLSGGVDLASIFSGGGGNQTLTFNSTNANLSISNGNTVSLSALSATGSAGDPAVNSLVHSNSANWNNSYTTVNAGSANWNSAYGTVSSLSANWNSVYQSASSQPFTLVDSTSSIQPIRGNNTASGSYSSVLGGTGNTASGFYSNVAGGKFNCAIGANSFVGGGDTNCTTNANDVVAGGDHNCATGGASFVGGGRLSTASAQYATVAGGNQNSSTGYGASVLGGQSNTATANYSNVAGGAGNSASGSYSSIVGGQYNAAYGPSSAILGGLCNTASNTYTSIGGGSFNVADGYGSNIAGGQSNYASDGYSFVGGGYSNTVLKHHSSIVGGQNNFIVGCFSSIVGGLNNTLSGINSFVAGGSANNSGFNNTFILGTDIVAPSADYTYVNNLSSQGNIAAANIIINKSPSTFINPVTASGSFLIININGVNKAIQLWDYSS